MKNMFRCVRSLYGAAVMSIIVMALGSEVAHATFQIDVFASTGPAPGSTNYSGYLGNGVSQILSDNIGAGTASAPEQFYWKYYLQSFTVGEITSSSDFNSWKGVASPTSPFDGEFGSAYHVGIAIYSEGIGAAGFKLSDVSLSVASSDAANSLGFSISSFDYSATVIGFKLGPSGLPFADDMVVINSPQVDDPDLFAAVIFDPAAYSTLVRSLSDGGGDAQTALDTAASLVPSDLSITATVNVQAQIAATTNSVTGGTSDLSSPSPQGQLVPEPGSATLMFAGVAFATGLVRRRQRKE